MKINIGTRKNMFLIIVMLWFKNLGNINGDIFNMIYIHKK